MATSRLMRYLITIKVKFALYNLAHNFIDSKLISTNLAFIDKINLIKQYPFLIENKAQSEVES